MNLDHQWEGCFSDTIPYSSARAWLRGLTDLKWRTRVRD